MRKNARFIYIYKITNKINDKIYIGIRKRRKNEDPYDISHYASSSIWVKNSIKKYGADNFTKEILYFLPVYCWKQALLIESKIVNKKFVKSDNTYNRHTGGAGELCDGSKQRGRKLSPKHIKKIVDTRRARGYFDSEYRQSIAPRGEKHWCYGKSATNKGISPSIETRRKTSKTTSGISKSKKKLVFLPMYIPSKKRASYREANGFYGKKHSEETIKKLKSQKKEKMKSVIINNVIYESRNEAARQLNVSRPTIANRINSDAFPEYNWYHSS